MSTEQKIKVDENGVTFRCPSCTRRVMSPHEILGMRMQCPKCGDNIPTPSDTHPDYLAWQQEQKEERKAVQQQAREEKAASKRRKKGPVKKSSSASSSIQDEEIVPSASEETQSRSTSFSVKTSDQVMQSHMEGSAEIRPTGAEYSGRRAKPVIGIKSVMVIVLLLVAILAFQVEAFIRSFSDLDQKHMKNLRSKQIRTWPKPYKRGSLNTGFISSKILSLMEMLHIPMNFKLWVMRAGKSSMPEEHSRIRQQATSSS